MHLKSFSPKLRSWALKEPIVQENLGASTKQTVYLTKKAAKDKILSEPKGSGRISVRDNLETSV